MTIEELIEKFKVYPKDTQVETLAWNTVSEKWDTIPVLSVDYDDDSKTLTLLDFE